jgi:hypothetical protein
MQRRASRVPVARHLAVGEVERIIDQCVEGRTSRLLGDPVNSLDFNLDKRFGRTSAESR